MPAQILIVLTLFFLFLGAAVGAAVVVAAAGGGRPPTGPAVLPPTALCPEVGTGAGPDPTLDLVPDLKLIRKVSENIEVIPEEQNKIRHAKLFVQKSVILPESTTVF